MSKPGDIEFFDESTNTIKSLVTIGDSERDAIIRAEEFVREYFGDDAFVASAAIPVKDGIYKVNAY